MSARSPRSKTTGKPMHSPETIERMAKAKAHYQTRARRRVRGQSQMDDTKYFENGKRKPAEITAWLVELLKAHSPTSPV